MSYIKRLWDYQWAKRLHDTDKNALASTGHHLVHRKRCVITGSIVRILPREGNTVIKELVLGDHFLHTKRDNTVQHAGATSLVLPDSYSDQDDYYNDCWVYISSGFGAGQYREITDYDGELKVCTVDHAWTYQPDMTGKFYIVEGRSVMDDRGYNLRGRNLVRDDAVVCANVPFGLLDIDCNPSSAWIFFKETKIPAPDECIGQCNTTTSTTTTPEPV